jgi:CSLREA domain-containing protein
LSVLLTCGAAAILASCQLPPLSLTANTVADGHDATPGDGTCEMTAGAGDCSLRAAIEEANSYPGVVDITVPPGLYQLSSTLGSLVVAPAAGKVSIHAPQPGAAITGTVSGPLVEISSGTVSVTSLSARGGFGVGILVAGGTTTTLRSLSITGTTSDGLAINADATVLAIDVTIAANRFAGVTNFGTFDGSFVTIAGNRLGGFIGSGTVELEGSVVAQQTGGTDCAGAVVSDDYNLDDDGTCGLTAAHDVSGGTAMLGNLTSGKLPVRYPQPGSGALDAIPSGTSLCVSGATDEHGTTRPLGPACDMGAAEAPARP